MSFLPIGIGAGLAAAFLFAVVITGSPLAMMLSYLAPLPILIAALGWNHRSGLVASAVGGIATAVGLAALTPGLAEGAELRQEAGFVFALGVGLPAWWLAYLALLGRPGQSGAMEWYPVGRLLLWAALASAALTLAAVLALGDGSYDTYQATLRQTMESVLRQGVPAGTPPAAMSQYGPVLEALIGAVPFLGAAVFTLVFTLNLWLAARTVRTSGRLPREWPFLPATMLPQLALPLLVGGFAAAFLPGLIGAAGLALAGALTVAFALQGLSFVHQTTSGRAGRTGLLTGLYLLIVFIGHTILPMLAILGMADSAFALRRRFGAGPAGPNSPST